MMQTFYCNYFLANYCKEIERLLKLTKELHTNREQVFPPTEKHFNSLFAILQASEEASEECKVTGCKFLILGIQGVYKRINMYLSAAFVKACSDVVSTVASYPKYLGIQESVPPCGLIFVFEYVSKI